MHCPIASILKCRCQLLSVSVSLYPLANLDKSCLPVRNLLHGSVICSDCQSWIVIVISVSCIWCYWSNRNTAVDNQHLKVDAADACIWSNCCICYILFSAFCFPILLLKRIRIMQLKLFQLKTLLWPPDGMGQAIIFLSCGFFYLLSFFPRLFSAIADWMSTILPHMVWH